MDLLTALEEALQEEIEAQKNTGKQLPRQPIPKPACSLNNWFVRRNSTKNAFVKE
ncbi:hypothetical protein [Carboxydocella sp. JDF658]|uniref:hypothetical protein n=1 Tax=Carboxydocella sp. JDF658 TaxID=1926600 RepID=UPI0013564EE1|nr:hypothetical protein [Carboxydocella sp. JDF658]